MDVSGERSQSIGGPEAITGLEVASSSLNVWLHSAQVLAGLGMTPAEPAIVPPPPPAHLQVQLDGAVVGHLPAVLAGPVVARLHAIKAAALALTEGRAGADKLPSLQV